MKRHNDEAYVLGTQALGETDLIVTLFAANAGRVRGVARSARNSRKRFGGRLEPLTLVRVEWTEKSGRELHRIEGVEGLRSYAAMQADPTIQAACAVLSELTEVYSRDGEPDPKCFDLLGAVLAAIEDGLDVFVALRYFEFWLARLHGLLPDLRSCATCGRVLDEAESIWVEPGGGARCRRCPPGSRSRETRLGRGERGFLARVRSAAPAGIDVDPAAARPGRAIEAWLRGCLESFAEKRFRCYRHLRAMAREAGPESDRS